MLTSYLGKRDATGVYDPPPQPDHLLEAYVKDRKDDDLGRVTVRIRNDYNELSTSLTRAIVMQVDQLRRDEHVVIPKLKAWGTQKVGGQTTHFIRKNRVQLFAVGKEYSVSINFACNLLQPRALGMIFEEVPPETPDELEPVERDTAPRKPRRRGKK